MIMFFPPLHPMFILYYCFFYIVNIASDVSAMTSLGVIFPLSLEARNEGRKRYGKIYIYTYIHKGEILHTYLGLNVGPVMDINHILHIFPEHAHHIKSFRHNIPHLLLNNNTANNNNSNEKDKLTWTADKYASRRARAKD